NMPIRAGKGGAFYLPRIWTVIPKPTHLHGEGAIVQHITVSWDIRVWDDRSPNPKPKNSANWPRSRPLILAGDFSPKWFEEWNMNYERVVDFNKSEIGAQTLELLADENIGGMKGLTASRNDDYFYSVPWNISSEGVKNPHLEYVGNMTIRGEAIYYC